MIQFDSDIEGKKARYGEVSELFEQHGFYLGGNWTVDEGFFDKKLSEAQGESIYVRIPAKVLSGNLDDPDCLLQFGKPFLIKHIVHTGIEEDQTEQLMMDQTGLSSMINQFQKPIETDGSIRNPEHWIEEGKSSIKPLVRLLQ